MVLPKNGKTMAAALAIVLMAALPTTALGQTDPAGVKVQAEHFEPLPNQFDGLWNLSTSHILPHLGWTVAAVAHFTRGEVTGDAPTGYTRFVGSVLKLEPGAAIGFFGFLEVGVVLPVAVYQEGDDLGLLGRPGETIDGAALGDLRAVVAAQVLDPDDAAGFGIGLSAAVSFPTGDVGSYNGEDGFRVEPRLALSYDIAQGTVVATNVGFYLREASNLYNVGIGNELRWGVGALAALGFVDGLSAQATVFGAVGLADGAGGDNLNDPAEVLAGLRYDTDMGLFGTVGGGVPIIADFGAPEFRVLATFGYGVPRHTAEEPEAEACPPIPDGPTVDGPDGCPLADTDGDGISDSDDGCVDQPEDVDGFEDTDGCPDDDNDGDGVADADDSCRNDAEDVDGFEDTDGCPDLDNDGDGFPDATDKCPDEAEVLNGLEDEDGCPDEHAVVLKEKTIEFADRVVLFETAKSDVTRSGKKVLDQVIKILVENPQVEKVQISGHTDDVGTADFNQKLSEQRATAVLDYLVSKGIEPGRLETRGFGESKPVTKDLTDAARRRNRRVELDIVKGTGSAAPAE